MRLGDMTADEFQAFRTRTNLVLIPFGATEAHGCHLPLDTDTLIAERVCRKVAELTPAFVAPAIPYGVCRSTGDHAGTIAISSAALRLLTCELLASLYRQGMRRYLLLSGHAGGTHNATLLDAAEEFLKVGDDIEIAVICEHHLVQQVAAGLVRTGEDSHAGEIETSRLLFAAPEKVRQPLAEAEWPSFHRWILSRNKTADWPGGVWGDPSAGSAEKGREIENAVVTALVEIAQQLQSRPG